jgi:hypothetical protein
MLVAVIRARLTSAPLGSLTRPRMVARFSCALSIVHDAQTSMAFLTRLLSSIEHSFKNTVPGNFA